MIVLTTEQFSKLSGHIYLKLGLQFDDKKAYFLQTRVAKRMASLGIDDLQHYLFLLCYADAKGREMQALANLITTNETYMFREYEQLEAFANYCLPEVLDAKLAKGEQRLRIWSAGCSSGEEAYTLAIILQEVFPQSRCWDCQIVATDIDQHVLELAAAGRYDLRAVKEVPPEYLNRHFTRDDEIYVVRPQTAKMVTTKHLNLHDPSAMREMQKFDFIFCRNVLIYFDDLSRKMAIDNFYNSLNQGGFIFLGHSESIGRISSAFRLRKVANHLVYCKQ